MNASVEQLNRVLTHVKETFVGKDVIVDLLGVCLVARENAFLLGPPGTAKSAIVRTLASCISGGRNFEYLLTRFTEPSEIFGPFDIRKLKDGELVTNVEGMLPEASMVFLDEIFNANSAILNSLLTALNERVFRRGKQRIDLPALTFVGASNLLPEEETLEALLDRFLVRVKCENVDPEALEKVLVAGRGLEKRRASDHPMITPEAVHELQRAARSVDVGTVRRAYLELIHGMRNAGIKVSDRRAVKFQNLIAASAYLAGRDQVILSDLWVLKHTWDTEEQIAILAGMVETIIEKDEDPRRHPQARRRGAVDAEQLLTEVEALAARWNAETADAAARNVLKDKLRYLQTQVKWLQNPEHKEPLESKINELWQTMAATR